MPSIKSPCLAILVLSLVFATLPVPVRADASHAAKRAVVIHVALVAGDDSCDEPVERAIFAGPLVDARNAFVADPEPVGDDEDQGDQVSSAPLALDDAGLIQHYEPPPSDSVPAVDLVIRGEKSLSAVFSRAGPAVGPVVPDEELRASLLSRGHRTAAQPPRFDFESGRRPVGLNPSIATDRPPFPKRGSLEALSSGAAPANRSLSSLRAEASADAAPSR